MNAPLDALRGMFYIEVSVFYKMTIQHFFLEPFHYIKGIRG